MSQSKALNIVEALKQLVISSHILNHHSVLDGFGHVSIRNPTNPSTFFVTGIAAALIKFVQDFTEYRVADGMPVDSQTRTSPFSEHYIHAAIYARFENVQSVVRSHARPVLPFTISGGSNQMRLYPMIHTAGFLSRGGVPVWDIGHEYLQDDTHHLLVNNYRLVDSLAKEAVISTPSGDSGHKPPFHSVVLQRGHGFVALGDTLQEAVYKAIYTVESAIVQSQALQFPGGLDGIFGLSEEEAAACAEMDMACLVKLWPLWTREVLQSPMYERDF